MSATPIKRKASQTTEEPVCKRMGVHTQVEKQKITQLTICVCNPAKDKETFLRIGSSYVIPVDGVAGTQVKEIALVVDRFKSNPTHAHLVATREACIAFYQTSCKYAHIMSTNIQEFYKTETAFLEKLEANCDEETKEKLPYILSYNPYTVACIDTPHALYTYVVDDFYP